MKQYVALMDFKDRATGLTIEAGAPYPPGERWVSDQWIEKLASSNNGVGEPVIAEKIKCKEENELKVEVPEKEVSPAPPLLDMTPLIEDGPKPKEETPPPNPFTPTVPKQKNDPFEGLSEQGVFDIFRILCSGTGTKVPETKEDYLDYLASGAWKKRNIEYKRELLNIFGVVGVSKFQDYVVDKTLEDLLTRVIKAKVKG